MVGFLDLRLRWRGLPSVVGLVIWTPVALLLAAVVCELGLVSGLFKVLFAVGYLSATAAVESFPRMWLGGALRRVVIVVSGLALGAWLPWPMRCFGWVSRW